jgi:hypothetical protein
VTEIPENLSPATDQDPEQPPEPDPSCPVCHTPNHDRTWRVCDRDQLEIAETLDQLVDLVHRADDPELLTPGTHGPGVGPIGGSHEPSIGVNVDALDLALGHTILGVLEDWERWWRETWNLGTYGSASEARVSHGTAEPNTTPILRNLTGCVAFLQARWPIAATVLEPPPEEFAHEVLRLYRHALAALGYTRFDLDPDPDAQEPFDYFIHCPADLSDRLCNHPIGMRHQPLPLPGHPPEQLRARCERCGTSWDLRTLLVVSQAAGTRIDMTLAEVRTFYGGVHERTIRRKVAAGILTQHRGRYRLTSTPEDPPEDSLRNILSST